MNQSGVMVAGLLGGFVVYLAMQGKLATYWSILLGGGAGATPAATTGSTTTGSTPTTTGSTTTPNVTSLPSSLASFFGLGGTGASSTPTGGVTTPTGSALPSLGLPNTSISTFFGL